MFKEPEPEKIKFHLYSFNKKNVAMSQKKTWYPNGTLKPLVNGCEISPKLYGNFMG